MPKYLNKVNVSQKVEEVVEVPQLGLGLVFYRQWFVYTDFHGDVQHHHGSHTYVCFYSNKVVKISYWTFTFTLYSQ